MHLHDQRFIFSHDTFQWVQHGNPIGLHILQEFETFGLQNFSKFGKFHEFLKLCANNEYKNYNMNSMQDTKGNLDNTTTTRLVLWAMQCTLIKKGVTRDFN
jgi:hypothetical protein